MCFFCFFLQKKSATEELCLSIDWFQFSLSKCFTFQIYLKVWASNGFKIGCLSLKLKVITTQITVY